jgi:hypothetical protein
MAAEESLQSGLHDVLEKVRSRIGAFSATPRAGLEDAQ